MKITESIYKLTTSLEEILYPPLKPYNNGHLPVSDIHTLWYAEYGSPRGVPVVVLHGGPGAGTSDNDMRFFDPKYYRIILFDQRGANRSSPFAELKDNNSQACIDDIEKLRVHLKIDKWLIYGGSWGSTLSIAYGEEHPNRCTGFILRGIFLGRKSEIDNVWYGIQDIFPEYWHKMINFLPIKEQDNLVDSYYKRLINPEKSIHLPAAQSFLEYDLTASFLMNNVQNINEALKNDKLILGCARIFTHFSVNNFFFKENQLLDNLHKIKHLPAIIVHGRYDIVCRAKSAYELHQNWPNSQLIFVQDAGHSSAEVGIAKALTYATKEMKNL
jgi:proline iminopeptidase